MVIVTCYVGFYHLFLYFRRFTKHREDLTFAICCFMMSLYGVYCVGMYNSYSLEQGVFFQRRQIAALTLIGTTFIWFVVDYLSVTERKIRNFFELFFIVSALIIIFDKSPMTIILDEPAIKNVQLPWGWTVTYYEVQPGVFVEFVSFMGMMVFVYTFIMARKAFLTGNRNKAKAMMGAIVIFCIGLINDVSVQVGFYQFIYIIEYCYMGIVLLMATSLSNEVVESVLRKEALQESEKKYRDLVDNSLVGIFVIQDNRIRFSNQRFAEIFGYQNPQEVSAISWDEFILTDDRELIQGRMTSVNNNHQMPVHLEFRGVAKNNRLVDIEAFIGHISLEHQPALQGTLVDITARKAAERQLKESSDELVRYNLELEQFVNVTSHHIQEPLRSISSYVQLLARRYKNRLDKKAHEYINFAVQGVERMHRLINDFLIYTQVSKPWQAKNRVSLLTVLKRVCSHLNSILKENQVAVHVDSLPYVFGEESKLELLLNNLILNAVAFKRNDQLHIELFSKDIEGGWQIGIRDDGIGIAPQYHRLIFGLFQKLDNKNCATGTGIGLSVCKKIVEQHHGQIWVESEAGTGSTFYFTLPDHDSIQHGCNN
jgi:PAS domain S-box-containing protein